MLQKEVKYGDRKVIRKGAVLEFYSWGVIPDIVIKLMENEIILDPEWHNKKLKQQEQQDKWWRFLAELDLGKNLRTRLHWEIPPFSYSSHETMLGYLWSIANGDIKVNNVGKKNTEILIMALEKYIKER